MQLAAAAFVAAPSRAQTGLRTLLPVDQSGRDPSLAQILKTLRGIVRRRDDRELRALMSPDFKVEFDIGKGPETFRRQWKSNARDSQVWDLLDRLLSLGGTFYSSTLFALPYVYTRFPTDLDKLRHVVLVRAKVPLRQRPDTGGSEVGTLDYVILPLTNPIAPPAILADPFAQVRHPDWGSCYVSRSDVYSPAGHRAFFEKRQGRWHWLSLAAATMATPPGLKDTNT
jgi:hypothetical protein